SCQTSLGGINEDYQSETAGQLMENQTSHHLVTIRKDHAKTINQITQGKIVDDSRQQNGTLHIIYGNWLVEQLREDLR
ncbi:hypothetical protein chiPu_0027745, partial [Chiloscyllium punctatum]|nr:hypothetical protein [Chiloscyllium punctatum]